MFQCPSCGKAGFKDDVAVARHMNQPRSGCSTWLQDIIRLQAVQTDHSMNIDDEHDIPDDSLHLADLHQDYERLGGWEEDIFRGGVNSDEGVFTGNINEEGTLPADDFIDWFPGSSHSYGKGPTFLDLFNSDENSVYRATNPYYPFSGRKDWEVASWLLRSGLSMGKIDSFLSLEMVGTLIFIVVESDEGVLR